MEKKTRCNYTHLQFSLPEILLFFFPENHSPTRGEIPEKTLMDTRTHTFKRPLCHIYSVGVQKKKSREREECKKRMEERKKERGKKKKEKEERKKGVKLMPSSS